MVAEEWESSEFIQVEKVDNHVQRNMVVEPIPKSLTSSHALILEAFLEILEIFGFGVFLVKSDVCDVA